MIPVLAYILAFFCFIIIPSLPVLLLVAPLVFFLRRFPTERILRLASVGIAYLSSLAGMIAAVGVGVYGVRQLGADPAWLMFLLPGVFVLWQDKTRLDAAQRGDSNVRELAGERGEEYDQQHDIWMKKAYMAGDVSGWVAAAIHWLPGSRFW